MAAPKGNRNARKARVWRDALVYVLDNFENSAIKKGQCLRMMANKLVEKALDGEMPAIKEIADRLDGKPHQAFVEVSDNRPIEQLTNAELEAIILDGLKRIDEMDEIEFDE